MMTRQRTKGGAAVLAYHSIRKSKFNPYGTSVRPEYFQEHMAWLKKDHPVISLSDFILKKREEIISDNAVVLTFDDGYADHYTKARPVLEKLSLPATFFVIAGTVMAGESNWWERLESLLPFAEHFPEAWKFEAGDKTHCLRFQSDPKKVRSALSSGVFDDFPEELKKNLTELSFVLRNLDIVERNQVLQELARISGCKEPMNSGSNILSIDQLKKLAANPLFEIGAHTVSHRTLIRLEPEQQRSEIVESKKWLEEIMGTRIRHFAYPFGSRSDYDSGTVALVREAGFESACTTANQWGETGLLEIPRFVIGNEPIKTFRDHVGEIFSQ